MCGSIAPVPTVEAAAPPGQEGLLGNLGGGVEPNGHFRPDGLNPIGQARAPSPGSGLPNQQRQWGGRCQTTRPTGKKGGGGADPPPTGMKLDARWMGSGEYAHVLRPQLWDTGLGPLGGGEGPSRVWEGRRTGTRGPEWVAPPQLGVLGLGHQGGPTGRKDRWIRVGKGGGDPPTTREVGLRTPVGGLGIQEIG